MKKSTSFLIFIQLLIIIFLAYIIYLKTREISNNQRLNPIKKGSIIFNPDKELKYFFELRASTVIEDKIDWLPHTAEHIINSDFLNETVDYNISKPLGTFRIVALGDSFTYGLYVNTKDSWVELLEKSLNNQLKCKNITKVEVINLGVPGYDIEYSVKRFFLRGQKYDPDLVLWFLKNDDFEIINEYFIPKEQNIVKKLNIDISAKDFFFKDGEPYPLFSQIIEEIKKEIGEKEFLSYQIGALKKINNLYTKNLLVFTFPTTNNRYQNIIKEFVNSRQNGYFYKNLTDIYKIGGLSLPDGHPNQKGHKVIANDMYNYLIKNNIIPCN